MSSFLYQRGVSILAGAGYWTSGAVFRALLERSTSTYSPNRDHDFVSDLTSLVELSVASYARLSLGTLALTVDDTNDLVYLSCASLNFGSLEVGQTVKSLIVYRQTGGSDATPADDELVLRYDGTFDITLAANAALNATTIYVDPLPCALAAGTALNFGGGATCTLSGAQAIGDRSLAVSALGASAVAGAQSTGVAASGNILPFSLGGGTFSITIPAAGLIQFKPK